jgi:hypothetical protein
MAMKTEAEIRAKLAEVLAIDGRVQPKWMAPGGVMFSKAAICSTLLWCLGENDDGMRNRILLLRRHRASSISE